MAERTEISWADATFNAWIGCTEVSNGPQGACVGCYAREQAARYGWAKWGDEPRHRTSAAYWRQPLAWNRKAAASGEPVFVFCCSLADVFDNQVPPEWRDALFDLIRATPHLTWLLLTKRPQNIVKLFRDVEPMLDGYEFLHWPRNAAIGCTVVTQAEADRDVPVLLQAKWALQPAFAFLSMEPLMEAVDIGRWLPFGVSPTSVDWVITGGETDQGKHRARPSHPEWFRSLRDQCAAAGVPFHFKQWGEWSPHRPLPGGDLGGDVRADRVRFIQGDDREPDGHFRRGDAMVARVGKKAAGRLLDGVLHDARPSIAA